MYVSEEHRKIFMLEGKKWMRYDQDDLELFSFVWKGGFVLCLKEKEF